MVNGSCLIDQGCVHKGLRCTWGPKVFNIDMGSKFLCIPQHSFLHQGSPELPKVNGKKNVYRPRSLTVRL